MFRECRRHFKFEPRARYSHIHRLFDIVDTSTPVSRPFHRSIDRSHRTLSPIHLTIHISNTFALHACSRARIIYDSPAITRASVRKKCPYITMDKPMFFVDPSSKDLDISFFSLLFAAYTPAVATLQRQTHDLS